MDVLKTLKYLVNFIFIAFIISAIIVLARPFYSQSYDPLNSPPIVWMLIFSLVHLCPIFLILFYLRKFVLGSDLATPFDKSTRNNLKLAGIFCLISAMIKASEVAGIISYYSYTNDYDATLIANKFFDFDSVFYMIFFGLFFIYLSKVLKSSDLIRQENKLTI